jgi:hypothetical protein
MWIYTSKREMHHSANWAKSHNRNHRSIVLANYGPRTHCITSTAILRTCDAIQIAFFHSMSWILLDVCRNAVILSGVIVLGIRRSGEKWKNCATARNKIQINCFESQVQETSNRLILLLVIFCVRNIASSVSFTSDMRLQSWMCNSSH